MQALTQLLQERQWVAKAACRNLPTHFFFPPTEGKENTQDAKAVCEDCPVREQCLEDAIKEEEDNVNRRNGIRGGMTSGERRRLAAERKRQERKHQ